MPSLLSLSYAPCEVRPCLNDEIESVHRICREYSSVIGQIELDTTSRQVLNTTESVGGQILNCFDIY